MADLATSLQTAKKAGYSDKEITDYLAQDPSMGAKVATARQAGYGDDEIVAHLADSVAKPAAPAKPAPKPAPSLWDEVVGAGAAAVDKFKSDAKTAFVDRPKEQSGRPLAEQVMRAPADIGQTAADVGRVAADALGVVVSPAAGAMHAVVRPAAEAINKGIGPQYTRPTFSDAVAGLQGKRPQWRRELTPAEAQTETENALNTALSALPAGKPAVANALASTAAVAPRVNALAETVAKFDRAGVDPMLATAQGGKGLSTTTNVVAENALAGGMVRNRLQGAVGQADASAQRIAGQYGQVRGRQITGENVQQGVTDFATSRANPTTFKAKSGALYDDAFSRIPNTAVTPAATSTTLNDILSRISAPKLAEALKSPKVEQIATALAADAGQVSFTDLRALRTAVREARGSHGSELRASVGDADLGRLEGALSEDIQANATTLGGPQAAQKLRRADQYYRAGQDRIGRALQPFADAKSGEGAYSRVVQAASSGATADAQKLLSLKRSLAPDEFGDVAANVLSELGKQAPGAAAAGEAGFSPSSFVTNYNKLAPRSREILFGATGGGGAKATNLKAELDNLAFVVDRLKGIEKGANSSKTAVNAQALATGAGLLNPATTLPTAGLLTGGFLTGEMMTNPVVVRWAAGLIKAKAASPAAYSNTVKQLGYAAKTNVQLLPLYQSLALEAPRATISAAAQEEPGNSQ